MKRTALFAGIVLAGAAAALVLALRATGKADAPGFFGLGTLQADVNLTLELLLVAGLTFGMMLARRGWKTLMRATLAGYWAVVLLGIATYRVWYA